MQVILTEEEYTELTRYRELYNHFYEQYTNLKVKYDKVNDMYSRLLVYGISNSNERLKDTNEFHAAYGIPCLSDLSPDYLNGKPNSWIHGFGVAYVMPDGRFNLYPIIITNGQFVFNGKIYGTAKKN